MMRTFYVSLAIAATTLTLVGAVLTEPSAAAQAQPQVSPAPEQAPVPAMSGGLCGLTQSDVADIVDFYDLDPDMQGVADALATPFDCSAYGNLCSALPASSAQAYACGAWTDMVNHMTVTEVASRARVRLADWADPCTPNMTACENICDPHSVVSCDAVLVNGECKTLALCDLFDHLDIPFFGAFLTPEL